MIKNRKTLLLLVIILIIFYIAITIILSLPKGKKYSQTVFIGNFTKVNVNNGKINVYNEDVETRKQDIKIYFKEKIIDGYFYTEEVDYDESKYGYIICNENGDYLSFDSTFILYTKDLFIDIKNIDTYESRDLSKIYDFSNTNNYSLPPLIELDYLRISNFDLDNDGVDEYIYSVGLIENSDTESNYESIVFYNAGDKYVLIDYEKAPYRADYKRLYFTNIIDFNNDGEYEFVVEKMMSEYGPDYYDLYSFDGSAFTKLGGE